MNDGSLETALPLADRVAAGAAFLDEVKPGWHKEIDVERLNLESSCRCVMGQLYGSYFGRPVALKVGPFAGVNHGLSLSAGTPEKWRKLDELWIKEVEIRNMDIGKEGQPVRVEPLENPVPQKQPAEAPRQPQT